MKEQTILFCCGPEPQEREEQGRRLRERLAERGINGEDLTTVGASGRGEGVRKLMAAVGRLKPRRIAMTELTRLTRDIIRLGEITAALQDAGVEVILTEDDGLDDALSRFVHRSAHTNGQSVEVDGGGR